VLVGHGPVVEALAVLGRAADYSLAIVAESDEIGALDLTRRTSVVVATHADSDEEALARVLATGADYVSLVASRRRAGVIVERLRARGVAPERLATLKAPAGLDIGAQTPEEIAVSILAEIIQHHRSEKRVHVEIAPAAVATEATDPICGMTVEISTARHRSDVAGDTIYFCCGQCKDTFDRSR